MKLYFPLLFITFLGACQGGEPSGDDPLAIDGAADYWGSSSSGNATSQWTEEDEEEFSDFIAQLGTARAQGVCTTLASCLRNGDANTLFSAEDRDMEVFADCADLPYVLRAYFAYKQGLPFSFVSSISGGRYSSGNTVTGHSDYRSYSSVRRLFQSIANTIHSGFYRLAPDEEDSDHYSIEVSRESIRPGTIYYDPNGHVLLVFEVASNGAVRMIDGHPDNSLTVTRFGEALARGSAAQGGGFRAWRSQRLESSGRVVRETNANARYFDGTEQYARSFQVDGRTVNYHEWVRYQLSTNGSRVRPTEEFAEMLEALCIDIQNRVNAVESNQIAAESHPGSSCSGRDFGSCTGLPSNIYGTDGAWESYSTPSRDARLKAAFRELHAFIVDTTSALDAGEARIDYSGTVDSLVQDYMNIWVELGQSECAIAYENSSGGFVELDLDQIMDRLFDLSFDPYHCPELRWGAEMGSSEMGTCPDRNDTSSGGKIWWYDEEYRLRNQIDRDYESVTSLSYGPESPPEIHIPGLLDELGASGVSRPEPDPDPTDPTDPGALSIYTGDACYDRSYDGMEDYSMYSCVDDTAEGFAGSECDGRTVSGYCPGAWNIRCCIL